MPSPELRYKVKNLYKEVISNLIHSMIDSQLLYLGREYPLGFKCYFRPRLHAAFVKNRDLKSDEEIEKRLKAGEYVKKGTSLLIIPANILKSKLCTT